MTFTELDAAIRAIAAELRAIAAAAPDMTGFDFARERGYVTEEEWQAAEDQSKVAMQKQNDQVARIDELRANHPELMTEYIEQLLGRIAFITTAIDDKLAGIPDDKQDRTLSFNRLLLPDIAKALTGWRDRTPSSAAWGWGSVYKIVDETAAALTTATP